ncbi:MAG TPA: tetratricopeptide repeat protein [Polyangiaceae bacterium]
MRKVVVSFRGSHKRLSLLIVAALLLAPPVDAEQAAIDTPSAAAGEASKIKPRAERQLGKAERPTVKQQTAEKASKKRSTRVNLQIPAALRQVLERKIDRRISRNIAQSRQLRREAMGLLRKFIAEAPKDAPEMPEALMRVGELEWEDGRDQFLLAFRQWEAKPVDTRGPPPDPDYSQARGRFLTVLKHHKSYRDYDLALYVDGFLAQEEGKFAESLGRFNKILAWFPKSRFVPDAHMVRAEYEFTKDAPDYQVAYFEYEQVLKHKDSELYDLALFKSAWTLWRLGKREEAAKRFLTVFKATADDGGRKRDKGELQDLQQEALKNLVAVFVEDEQNRAEDMHRFLVQAGGDKFADRIVKALAEAFYDQAHYERGIEAYRLLLKLKPTGPEAYVYALRIAQGHSTMEAWDELAKDYVWIIKTYVAPAPLRAKQGAKPAPAKSAWLSAQPAPVLARSFAATEKQSRQDAVGLHAKAQADKSIAEFQAAARLYEVYLSRFGTSDAAYEMYFNAAEIYFYHVQDANKAADNYLKAVRLKPKGALSRDALYNSLAALEVARANEFEADKKAGKKPEETPTDKKLTEAMELYVATYPGDQQIPELLFRQGKLYYDYEVYDPAVRQWGLLLEKYPRGKYATWAGELILDSFNKSKDYENIETWARRLKTAPSFQAPAQQQKLNLLIVTAVFKQGEQFGKAGDHDKAAQAYLRAATEFPKEPQAAQAAVNAEVEARRAADLKTLALAAGLLVKDHKQRPEAAQGIWIAANTYQEVGLFSEAADYHQVIVDNWPKYERHKDAAYNAVLLRTTVGEHDKAIQSGNSYKKYYSRDKGMAEVTFLMGKAHEKAEKWQDAEKVYARYANETRDPNAEIEALVRLAVVRKGDAAGRARALKQAMDVHKLHKGQLNDTGKYFAAKARYMQGEAVLAKFEQVTIEGDVKQLKQRLKTKSNLLKQAAETFLDTSKMGVAEWTTASLYQIGFTYEAFAQALLNSPPPENLSADEKDLYSQAIDEFVIPIEESSLEAYESGWLKAVELGIFNSWTAKMREALGRLNSELYPPLGEIGFELRSKGPLPMPALIEGPRRGEQGQSELFLIDAPGEKADASEKAEKSEAGADAADKPGKEKAE